MRVEHCCSYVVEHLSEHSGSEKHSALVLLSISAQKSKKGENFSFERPGRKEKCYFVGERTRLQVLPPPTKGKGTAKTEEMKKRASIGTWGMRGALRKTRIFGEFSKKHDQKLVLSDALVLHS